MKENSRISDVPLFDRRLRNAVNRGPENVEEEGRNGDRPVTKVRSNLSKTTNEREVGQ